MPIVNPKVEIEFTAGVWTDVTTDVELDAGISIKYGRTSEFSDAQTGTCDFQLANHFGKYLPGAQVLADGTTAHPYYPNVVPRKRVRVGNTSGNRFVGYIKSWSPSLENGVRPITTVSASDRQDQLSRINLLSFYEEELALTAPACSYLLSDTPASAGAAAVFLDSLGVNPPMVQTILGGTSATFAPGAADPMPQSDGLTGVSIVTPTTGGALLSGSVSLSAANFGFGTWVTIPIGTPALNGLEATQFDLQDSAGYIFGGSPPTSDVQIALTYSTGATLSVLAAAQVGSPLAVIGTVITGSAPNDGKPHHYMVRSSTSGGIQSLTLYVDGVSQGTSTFTAGQLNPLKNINTLFMANVGGLTSVQGPQAAWSGVPASTVPALLTLAGNGRPGDLSGQRVTRFLQYLGLTAGEYSIDAGAETLSGSQSIRGKSALGACQEVATTEGAGASFYVNTDGLARFCDRTFRKPAVPNFTLSAALDLDGDFAPTYDELTLVNQSTVTRGGGNEMSYTDAASAAQYGTTTDTATSYASTDQAALNLAQQRVAAQSKPGIRIPQFTVDLLTSSVAASVFAGVQIGWRARINTLPSGVNAASQVDVIIEGWAEQITKTSWALTFDASPADVPSRMIWDDTTYGRWQCQGQTLNAGITAAATTVVIATSAGNPTFTTSAGAYPLKIVVGAEHISLNSAPGGATSPQTFTGCTRGQDGTTAAAQASGAVVDLYPTSTWTL